jgi:hypothetical protein
VTDVPVKPVLKLVVQGGTDKVVAYACPKCRIVARDEAAARDCYHCCTSRTCEECGKPTEGRSWLVCDPCRRSKTARKRATEEAKAFNAAKKVSAKDYEYDYVCTDLWGDEDSYTLVGEGDEDEPWVWGCTPMPWPVPDMEGVFEDMMMDEFPEEARCSLTNVDELQELVAAWVKAKGPSGYYMIDRSTVVVLDPDNTPETL